MASRPRARCPSITTFRRSANSPGPKPKSRNSSWPSTVPTRMKIWAASATPGSALTFATRLCGSTDRVRSEAPCWKRPKSERPTWIRSFAVFFTPAVMESRATISPTPIATPAPVRAVRALRRSRFLSTRPPQVTGLLSQRAAPNHVCGPPPGRQPRRAQPHEDARAARASRGARMHRCEHVPAERERRLPERSCCGNGGEVDRGGHRKRARPRHPGCDQEPAAARAARGGQSFRPAQGEGEHAVRDVPRGEAGAAARPAARRGELRAGAVRARGPGRLSLLSEWLRTEQAVERAAGAPAGRPGDDAELADGDGSGRAHGRELGIRTHARAAVLLCTPSFA